MSNIIIHQPGLLGSGALGRAAQRAALAPWPGRPAQNLWQPLRTGWARPVESRRIRQRAGLPLLDEGPGIGPVTPIPPPRAASRAIETINYAIRHTFTGTTALYYVFGQHVVGYPYRLVGVSARVLSTAAPESSASYNIMIRNSRIDGTMTEPDGAMAISNYVSNEEIVSIRRRIGPTITMSVGGELFADDNLFYECGSTIYQPGTVPCFIANNAEFTAVTVLAVSIKIEEVGGHGVPTVPSVTLNWR